MNRDEIIKHVRYILKHRKYNLTEQVLRIKQIDYKWALTFIADSMPCPKEAAERILLDEVLQNITLIVEGSQGSKKAPEGYTTLDEIHNRTDISKKTLEYWIKSGYMKARKYQGIWIIAHEEANACVIDFRRRHKKKEVKA